MNTQRWTLDSDINDYLSDMVPPKDIIEKLIIEREPIEAELMAEFNIDQGVARS